MRHPMDPETLRSRLPGYAHVEMVGETGSTNTDLADRVRRGEELPDGSVLLAEAQTAGRGRQGRTFFSPAGSQVICSVLLRITEVPAERLGLLPLLTGLSIAEAIRSTSDVPATVKWPNDIMCGEYKLAGILVEAVHLQPHAAVVVGFGVNYDLRPDEIDVEHANSVAELATERVPSREDFCVAILTSFAENLRRWRGLGGAPQTFLSRYRELSSTLGQQVRALLPGDEAVEGRAVDVDEEGELILRVAEGRSHVVRAGEIVHLR